MLRNYRVAALRNPWRHRAYAAIDVIGLVVVARVKPVMALRYQ